MPYKKIKEQVKSFPRSPGVYLMKDGKGVVLYVGKAKSLRSRVASYFAGAPSDTRPHIAQMLPLVDSVEYIGTESEVEALLMESRLVKDTRPAFNRELRDDKMFPFLEISRGDDFPGVYVTRRCDNPRSKYYGPFTDVGGLRGAVRIMQRAFRFRTCSMDIRRDDPKRRFNRPCLLYYIECCLAPCADYVTHEDYSETMRLLQRFLDGKRKRVLSDMEREMIEYSEMLQYEKAARLRDQIKALRSLGARGELAAFPEATLPPNSDPKAGLRELQKILGLAEMPRTIDGVDVAHLSGEAGVASIVRFVDGRPFKEGYRRFRIKTVEGIDDFAMMGEVAERRFRRIEKEEEVAPDILLLDGGPGQLSSVLKRLEATPARPAAILALAKREEEVYFAPGEPPLRLKRASDALKLLQYVRDEAHRFAQHYHHLLRDKSFIDKKQRKRRKSTGNA